MKKLLLLLLFALFTNFSFSNDARFCHERFCFPQQVRIGYSYFDIGINPMPYPSLNLGVGIRRQFHHHGFDTSLQFAPLYCGLKGNAAYHYYFYPSRKAQTYCGVALSSGYCYDDFFFTPQLVFGREWKSCFSNRRFLQFRTNLPFYAFPIAQNRLRDFPILEFSYGMGF